MVSLDGFMEGPSHDLSWHNVDKEFNEFAADQMEEPCMLLFGRKTYELMRDFWPAYKPVDPENKIVREKMDTMPKIVFSKTLEKVSEDDNWKNVRLMHEVDPGEIKKLKQSGGDDKYIAVFGSNNLCVTLLELGLLDELRIMVNPVVIGKGTLLFKGIKDKLNLKLIKTRVFKNGNILLCYQPLR